MFGGFHSTRTGCSKLNLASGKAAQDDSSMRSTSLFVWNKLSSLCGSKYLIECNYGSNSRWCKIGEEHRKKRESQSECNFRLLNFQCRNCIIIWTHELKLELNYSSWNRMIIANFEWISMKKIFSPLFAWLRIIFFVRRFRNYFLMYKFVWLASTAEICLFFRRAEKTVG